MIQYSEALKQIIESASSNPLGVESVELEHSVGRVLAEDVVSPELVPSFDNSAMDGFLLRSSETANASEDHPCTLSVQGLIAAGDSDLKTSTSLFGNGNCFEIMTGAALPESPLDAVVRIEDVRLGHTSHGGVSNIQVSRPILKGENIRGKGTDFVVGQKILSKGTVIEPHQLLGCAALGISKLKVRKKARFAIVSTGSELVAPSVKELPRGMIRNSTGPYLMTLLTEMGVEAHSFGIIPDDQLKYQELLSKLCSDSYDGVISTGAVSMGKFDFVSDALKALGAKIHFHKASIRPGKPILFAELKAAERNLAFFGMPGNPVSTAVGCRFFFAPYLRAISGLGSEVPAKAKLVLGIKKPEGMRCFYKARMYIEPDGIQAVALKSQASYVVSSFVESNCWAIFPEDGSHFAEGALVDIVPLSVRRGFNDYDSN